MARVIAEVGASGYILSGWIVVRYTRTTELRNCARIAGERPESDTRVSRSPATISLVRNARKSVVAEEIVKLETSIVKRFTTLREGNFISAFLCVCIYK